MRALYSKIKYITGGGIPGYNRKINEIIEGLNHLFGMRSINGQPITDGPTGPVIDLGNIASTPIVGIDSIYVNGNTISLQNDVAVPTNGQFYGFQSGALGWFTPGGSGSLGNRAMVNCSTNQSFTAVAGLAQANVSWTTVLFDTVGYFNLGSDATLLTIATTGYYLIGFHTNWLPQGTYSSTWVNATTYTTLLPVTWPGFPGTANAPKGAATHALVWPTTFNNSSPNLISQCSEFWSVTGTTTFHLSVNFQMSSGTATMQYVPELWIIQIA